jgi:uncharacterized protein YpmS
MAPANADSPAPEPDYAQILRELKPRMMFEITEANLNAYLHAHPEDFTLPEGLSAPYVALGDGVIEVSALTKMLFVPTRVRVKLLPVVVCGRLRLTVQRVRAGPVPLPGRFLHGVAEAIVRPINDILERNEVQLESLVSVKGLLRLTAQASPTSG